MMPEETTPEKKEMTPVEHAVFDMQHLLPLFRNLVNMHPNKKGLARVLVKAAEFPLVDDKPKFRNPQERQLFEVFIKLLDDKITIMDEIVIKHLKEKEQGEANVPTPETNEGVVNGNE